MNPPCGLPPLGLLASPEPYRGSRQLRLPSDGLGRGSGVAVALTCGLAVGLGDTVRDAAPQAANAIDAKHAVGNQGPRRPRRGRLQTDPEGEVSLSDLTLSRICGPPETRIWC